MATAGSSGAALHLIDTEGKTISTLTAGGSLGQEPMFLIEDLLVVNDLAYVLGSVTDLADDDGAASVFLAKFDLKAAKALWQKRL